MIPNFNTFLKEATWNDIRKQSAGAKTRLEDDVNLMDGDEFFGYLLANYKYNGSENITCGSTMIKIPIFRDPHSRMPKTILFNHKNKTVFVRTPIFEKWPEDMKQLIFDNYNVEDGFNDVRDHIKFILPKEGECDNKFVLGLIDSMLKTAKYPYLEKRISESVWNDIRKQSSGIQGRKEDYLDNMKPDEFVDALNSLYVTSIKKIYDSNANFIGISVMFLRTLKGQFAGWPLNIVYGYENENRVYFSNKKFKELCPHLYNELDPILDMRVESDGFTSVIPPHNQKVTHSFFVYVIDTIIAHLDEAEEEIMIEKK